MGKQNSESQTSKSLPDSKQNSQMDLANKSLFSSAYGCDGHSGAIVPEMIQPFCKDIFFEPSIAPTKVFAVH